MSGKALRRVSSEALVKSMLFVLIQYRSVLKSVRSSFLVSMPTTSLSISVTVRCRIPIARYSLKTLVNGVTSITENGA